MQIEETAPKSLPPLSWVKPPQQARSQKTFERILDAAEAHIVESGVQSLTVSNVVARARSSVGAFYARFPDKLSLLRTLHEREFEQSIATCDVALDPARWEDIDVAVALEQVVHFCVRLFIERQELIRAFRSVGGQDESFAERHAKLGREIAARLERLLESRADEIPHHDLSVAANVSVRIILGALESDISTRHIAPPEDVYSTEKLGAELTRALLGYLGIPVSTRRRR